MLMSIHGAKKLEILSSIIGKFAVSVETEKWAIPGVGGILECMVKRTKYILIQERCKNEAPLEYGLLEIPTGKVREFENVFACLRREVKEETGLDVISIQGEEAASIREYTRYKVLQYAPFASVQNLKGDYPILAEIFICRVNGRLKSQTDETRNLRWISLPDLRKLLETQEECFYPMHIATLKKYLNLYL
jgi:ADP-ribose pyrophosphatase